MYDFILAYSGESDKFARTLSQEYPSTLICLDSGTSFRTNLNPNYIPRNREVLLTKRFPNISFKLFENCEAEDIKALYEIKYKKHKVINPRRLLNKILRGNESRGLKRILSSEEAFKIADSINQDANVDVVIKNLMMDLDPTNIKRNHDSLRMDLEVFRSHLPNFEALYESL